MVELQDNIHATLTGLDGFGIEGLGALAQELDRFAHCGVGEIDARDNNLVELAADRLRASRSEDGLFDDGGWPEVDAANRCFPCLVDLRDHGGAGVVVGRIGHAHFAHVDLLHATACGHVIAVEAQRSLVFGSGLVEASGIVKSLAFVQEGLHFLHFRDESGRDGLVEIVRRLEAGEEALGGLVVRIVLRLQDDADGFLGILPTSFLDAGLGQAHHGFGKTVYCARSEFADIGRIRQGIDGCFVLGVSRLVVALHEGN